MQHRCEQLRSLHPPGDPLLLPNAWDVATARAVGAAVRDAASAPDYPLVINARVDLFLGPYLAGADPSTQIDLVREALERASTYLEAGADFVYPIALWELGARRRFMAEVAGR